MDRGHDVTVLEASGRAGGHVKTIHDPLPDNLYADVGAEHFNKPGYDQYWKYVNKFDLPYLAYRRRDNMLRRIDGTWYSEEKLQDPAVLAKLGFNRREVDFIVQNGWTELPQLYFGPYLDAIQDEYQPFGVGLDAMDEMPASELLIKDGASDAGLRFNGLRRGDGTPAERASEVSALYRIWLQSIMKRRGLPNFQRNCFRLQGGNQRMTDTFAARLGERVRLGCPITAIEHGDWGVTVEFQEFGEAQAGSRVPGERDSDRHPDQDPHHAGLARVEGLYAEERRLRQSVARGAAIADAVLEGGSAEHQPGNGRSGDVPGLSNGRRSSRRPVGPDGKRQT